VKPEGLLALEPPEIWSLVWAQLARATADPRHAFRLPVVASAGPRWGVQARTVVLRGASLDGPVLALHSDRRAAKIETLERRPELAWCSYDPRHRVQIRAATRATLHHDDDVANAAWEGLGSGARALHAVEPAPGTPRPRAARMRAGTPPDAGRANFVVVRCRVDELDWLLLARGDHRRIGFRPAPGGSWHGTELVP